MESSKQTCERLTIKENNNFDGNNSAFISSEKDKVVNGGEAHNYVMCVLSDTEDDDTNVNARVNNTLPKVCFLNDEVTLQLVNPSISELGSNNTGITAETMKVPSIEWSQSSQQQEESNIRDVGLVPNLESVAGIVNSDRECINSGCTSNKSTTTFYVAPMLALSYFNIKRKYRTRQYVCEKCFDDSINNYERMCAALVDQRPLPLHQLPSVIPEVIEIDDSDDESDNNSIDSGNPLPAETLALLEDHLDDSLKKTINRINIEQQIVWTNEILEHKLEANAAITDSIEKEINSIQNLSEAMHTNIYKSSKEVIEHLPPFDLNTNKTSRLYGPNYPPRGVVDYPPVETYSLYYAIRTTLLSTWMPCKVVEFVAPVDEKAMFSVRFLRGKDDDHKTVSGNQLAYGSAPNVRLSVGTRVIALSTAQSSSLNFQAGFVGEPLQAYNRWRYLIFFDSGCVRYVTPDNIRLICVPSANVWDDVYSETATFVKTYLEQYKTERPMVEVKRGQKMITEWNSQWRNARVEDVDGSLVYMNFDDVKRWEWIYRGSTRLGPLYKENMLQKRSALMAKGNQPSVEHVITIDDDDDDDENRVEDDGNLVEDDGNGVEMTSNTLQTDDSSSLSVTQKSPVVSEKKSTEATSSQPTVQHMNNSTIYLDEGSRSKGRVIHYTAKRLISPRKLVTHICGAGCLYPEEYDLSSYSPLVKPLLSGWDRRTVIYTKTKRNVYRTPCGRTMRNMSELHVYLRATKCPLNVDNFDFGIMTACLAEYVVDSKFIKKKDMSDGREAMTISIVNYYDNTMPPPLEYSAQRIPTTGVPLNLDPNFLCGCDCDDDCWDKTRCECWKMTLEGAQRLSPHVPIHRLGYEFKRLPQALPTGIYECNSQCKCNNKCLNRVAQHPLQQKLQVFKTMSRGWGLRCLNDVPEGTFICVYAGDLLTDKDANIAGGCYGDEYFAELDYIEVVENLKEGYEAETESWDNDTRNVIAAGNGKNIIPPTTLKTEPTFNSVEEDFERLSGSDANAVSMPRPNSILQFYDKDEMIFTMDAMQHGNMGRYINHSCEPNLFVQNVFVDTHDLRFPWVAFFAKCHIQAGTELTWDYNYVVGSVPGKVLFCECGSENCRRRIL